VIVRVGFILATVGVVAEVGGQPQKSGKIVSPL